MGIENKAPENDRACTDLVFIRLVHAPTGQHTQQHQIPQGQSTQSRNNLDSHIHLQYNHRIPSAAAVLSKASSSSPFFFLSFKSFITQKSDLGYDVTLGDSRTSATYSPTNLGLGAIPCWLRINWRPMYWIRRGVMDELPTSVRLACRLMVYVNLDRITLGGQAEPR